MKTLYEVKGFIVRKDHVEYGVVEYTYAQSTKKAINNITYRLKNKPMVRFVVQSVKEVIRQNNSNQIEGQVSMELN